MICIFYYFLLTFPRLRRHTAVDHQGPLHYVHKLLFMVDGPPLHWHMCAVSATPDEEVLLRGWINFLCIENWRRWNS